MSRGRVVSGPVSLFELFNLGSPELTDWVLDALCAETDPELFFPPVGGNARDAKRVCASCSVRAECLTDALEHPEPYGIRGGLSVRERQVLARQRRVGQVAA